MPRKKEFEPEEALEKAMRYFWAHGYNDTSIRDLIAGTGVNFYGLYNVFGDKRGIYISSLKNYGSTFVDEIKDASTTKKSIQSKLEAVYEKVADISLHENDSAGCMMCNAAVEVAPHDADVAKIVKLHRKSLEAFFSDIVAGMGSNTETRPISEFLATQVYMIGFLARSSGNKAQIKRHIKTLLLSICQAFH